MPSLCRARRTAYVTTFAAVGAISQLFTSTLAQAVSTDGTARDMVIPVVVQSSSFSSRVHLFNVSAVPASIAVAYQGALGTATPGPRSCGILPVGVESTANVDFAALCALGAGNHFGVLRLKSTGGYIRAYSRVSSPQGQGFSIEGFPAADFSGARLNVLGLRKSIVAPGYQSNCFVASLDEPANYTIRLFQPTGAALGTVITGTLAANQLVRYLDVFAAAGVGSVEAADVRAEIAATDVNTPALIGFCTVQNNTSFDADFRLGKPGLGVGARSIKMQQSVLSGQRFTSRVTQRFTAAVKAPDTVHCEVDGAEAALLQIRLVAPGGAVVAGGVGASALDYFTGPRSSIAGGSNALWQVQISPTPATQTFPIDYTFSCSAGNGLTRLMQLPDANTFF